MKPGRLSEMRRIRLFVAFVMLATGVMTVDAATPQLGKTSTLSGYLVYAAENNPGLEAAFLQWRAALERVPQVKALPDPRFTYRHFIRKVETRVGPQQRGAGIAQMFPWFVKLKARAAAVMSEANAMEQVYHAKKLKLFYQVKRAYYDYAYLARALVVVEEKQKLLNYLEQIVRARYRVDATKQSNLLRLQVEQAKLEDRLSSLKDLQAPTVARLNAALNRPADAPLPWPKEMPAGDPAENEDAKTLLAVLVQNSPELKSLDHKIKSARHKITGARHAWVPDVTLGIQWIDTNQARMRNVSDSGKDSVIAMVSFNIPLWYGKYRAMRREARARHRAAVRMRENRENMLHTEASIALYHFRDAQRRVRFYRDTLIPKARQSLTATESNFRVGTGSVTDFLDAERTLLELELLYERARADRATRLAEIEMLVGGKAAAPPEGTLRPAEDAPSASSDAE